MMNDAMVITNLTAHRAKMQIRLLGNDRDNFFGNESGQAFDIVLLSH
jgi:hypothetical protein